MAQNMKLTKHILIIYIDKQICFQSHFVIIAIGEKETLNMEGKSKTNNPALSIIEKAIVIFVLMFIMILMGYLEMAIQERIKEYAMIYTAGLYAAIAGAILLYAEWDKENEERKLREKHQK